jgi:hypothetical protein
LSAVSASAKVDPWITTKFEVYNAAPGFLYTSDEEDQPSSAELAKLEKYLTFVAGKLKSWGFPGPYLPVSPADSRCSLCYRIFLTDMGKGNAKGAISAMGYSPANEDYIEVRLNRDAITRVGKGGALTFLEDAYITAAHELFHAVQKSTRYLYDKPFQIDTNYPDIPSTNPDNWISEGTANAIAIDLARIWLKKTTAQSWKIGSLQWPKLLGARDYSISLAVKDDTEAPTDLLADYNTSSFWRYLAEFHASGGGKIPGIKEEPVDYRYLKHLFSLPNRSTADADQYRWLNDGLMSYQNNPAAALTYLYPRFVTTAADYRKTRVKEFLGTDPQDYWGQTLFGNCVNLVITATVNSGFKKLAIPPLAAKCITIDLSSPLQGYNRGDTLAIDLQIETDSEMHTNQLWLGGHNGKFLARRSNESDGLKGNNNLGIWKSLPAIYGKKNKFILSNVSGVKPGETLSVAARAYASVSKNGVNTRKPAKTPTRKSNTKGASREVNTGPDSRASEATARARRSAAILSPVGQEAVRLNLSDNHTELELGMAGGGLSAAMLSHGSGGFIDHLLTSGQAMLGSMASVAESTIELDSYIENTEDAIIDISFPRIDYGFTGTINNALIQSVGGGGPSLLSISTRDSIPGPQRHFEKTGSVTITEYSPYVLSGTFSADLVDPHLTAQQKQQSLPELRKVRSVSGYFSYSAPWLRDERFAQSDPGELLRDMDADLSNMLPEGMHVSDQGIVRDDDLPPEARQPASPFESLPGNTSHGRDCDCSCEGFNALQRVGESATGAPDADDQAIMICAVTCMAQYMQCDTH